MEKGEQAFCVAITGRSWPGVAPSFYCFEATVDDMPIELNVAEEVAFDFLQAWTPSRVKCLETLRLHRADLARALERKIQRGYRPEAESWLLTSDDMARVLPTLDPRWQAAGLRLVSVRH